MLQYRKKTLWSEQTLLGDEEVTNTEAVNCAAFNFVSFQFIGAADATADATAAVTNQSLTYTAVGEYLGTAGNDIDVNLVGPAGIASPLSIEVENTVITVNLAGTRALAATGTIEILDYEGLVDSIPDSFEIAGVEFTAQVADSTPGAATFTANYSNAQTADSLAAQINAHTTTQAAVMAVANGDEVTITALAAGTAGNSIALAYNNNGDTEGATVENPTLQGGGIEILIEFDNEPIAGSFTLKYDDNESDPIAYDDDDAAFEAAIQEIPGFENATAEGDFTDGFTINVALDLSEYDLEGGLLQQTNTLVSVEEEIAEAILDLTADITLTDVAGGDDRNTQTFTLQVLPAAANPTDTVLIDFTGTAAAIICTVTPNNGDNNSATPVTVTTANLVELINTGLITGKNPTITDGDSLRELQTAAGGDTTVLADSGEGDGEVAIFSGGVDAVPVGIVINNANAQAADGVIEITDYENLLGSPADSVEIAGVTFVAQAGAVTEGDATFQADSSEAATATSLAAQINAHAVASTLVEAAADEDIVIITALAEDTSGNEIELVYNNVGSVTSGSVSDANLSGGAAVSITTTGDAAKTAINADAAAMLLVLVSGTNGSALTAASLSLVGGTDAAGTSEGDIQIQVANTPNTPEETDWVNYGNPVALDSTAGVPVNKLIDMEKVGGSWIRAAYTADDDTGDAIADCYVVLKG